MSKIILVSNRLSTSVKIDEDGSTRFSESMGGLATGLASMHEKENSVWVGWSGVPEDDLTEEQSSYIDQRLREDYKSRPVPLTNEELESFYYGFCNDTIWPLFHYFPTFAQYTNETWQAYRAANEKYFRKVMEVAEDGDIIWVHDYQLMLLPHLLKEELPDSKIGFFLHIPFPSYEVFRLMPWREEILRGLLGADLVGFHTYDYARHFLSSIRRILGAEHSMGNVKFNNRMVKVDAFPMGIDYEKYSSASSQPEIQDEIEKVRYEIGNRRLILSVDRLDYSKGIPLRIKAFHNFLENHPEYHERVQLILIAAPSRMHVPHYIELKREIDELVSTTNGAFGTIGWNPIQYFFRAVPFPKLTAIYTQADVLLVTPLRDGMNLISKEYLAARGDRKGVLILSETAGSARELGEAISVNPNNIDEIAGAIKAALEMPVSEQQEKSDRMHRRLKRYDIHYWAQDFMEKLDAASALQSSLSVKKLSSDVKKRLIESYKKAKSRLIMVDYDGTLISYGEMPGVPDADTMASLQHLAENEKNEVVIISGRQRDFLESRLQDLPVGIIAGHGIWIRETDGTWQKMEEVTAEWKEIIQPVLELYRDRTPGSAITVNEYSLVWHYERAQPELAALRLSELKDALLSLTSNLNLSVLEGNKLLEIKNSNVSKGRAASQWYQRRKWDFVTAIGDDWTDEDIFRMLGPEDYTIKVGLDVSSANYFLESVEQVRAFIRALAPVD